MQIQNRERPPALEVTTDAAIGTRRPSATLSLSPPLAERVKNLRQMPVVDRSRQREGLDLLLDRARKESEARQAEGKKRPELLVDGPKAKYGSVKNAGLFGANGPRPEDVDQGRLGDCFFMSVVGSLVANSPEAIRDMIKDNRDGTYSVRFYDNGKPVTIVIDGALPLNDKGKLVYARGADSDGDKKLEIWVPLLEKAYAKFRDQYGSKDGVEGYGEIDGGYSDVVMKALTGQDATWSKPGKVDAFTEKLERANDGELVTIGTQEKSVDGWVGEHAYTVVGTFERDGDSYVILRNPWAEGVPDDSEPVEGGDIATFAVSVDDLRAVTVEIDIGAPPKPPANPPVLFILA
jgi:hypothetical protein